MRFPINPQIVGGSKAPQGAYPYIVSLQWGPTKETASHFCAGSILNSQWIITAAHCIQAVPNYGVLLIKAGKNKLSVVESTEQAIEAEKSIPNEQYQGINYSGVGPYDIGMIKLKGSLKFTKEVQPIELLNAEDEPTGDAALCGWGSTEDTFPGLPDDLQHIKLMFVDRVTCHKNVERLTGYSPVHETNVCTGPLTGGISACSGDSGGPLIKRYGNKPVLAGVVSWGIIPCGTVGAPSVYAKVSKFNTWIEKNVASN
ncbi:chymotrypsin-2-like [Ooceraea biroi]|uniref:chymotrypsin-2-like n=1 Tax=Ooceraea biroi TaxID=2015173 RepID=UPI000F080A91|nr:chymotrypsin-2-like [Ooceraea biroi]